MLQWQPNQRMAGSVWVRGAALAAGLTLLAGCGDEDQTTTETETEYLTETTDPVNYNDSSTVSQPSNVDSYASSASVIPDTDRNAKANSATEQTPGEIAQESNSDYASNDNGLITAGTLQHWMDDWDNNKPNDSDGNPIAGDLVILQVNGGTYFQGDAANGIRTYRVAVHPAISDGNTEFHETRNNGVMDSVTMVASESLINDTMAKYDIDPTEDMVVAAMGKGGGFHNMQMGRIWYALRYWGAPADHLAMLNGGAQYHADKGTLTSTSGNKADLSGHYSGTPAPPNESLSNITPAADLPEANMDLMISYEGMLNEAKQQRAGVFMWDARSAEEYYGLQNQGRGYAGEGHIRGAVNLNYGELLVDDEGFRYMRKSALRDRLEGLGFEDGQQVITYCVTTYRAMITGIATGLVLGEPTRFYDGAWMQWGDMAYHQNKQGTYNLAKDSPWRSDIPEASRWTNYDPDAEDSGDTTSDGGGDDGTDVPSQGCG